MLVGGGFRAEGNKGEKKMEQLQVRVSQIPSQGTALVLVIFRRKKNPPGGTADVVMPVITHFTGECTDSSGSGEKLCPASCLGITWWVRKGAAPGKEPR